MWTQITIKSTERENNLYKILIHLVKFPSRFLEKLEIRTCLCSFLQLCWGSQCREWVDVAIVKIPLVWWDLSACHSEFRHSVGEKLQRTPNFQFIFFPFSLLPVSSRAESIFILHSIWECFCFLYWENKIYPIPFISLFRNIANTHYIHCFLRAWNPIRRVHGFIFIHRCLQAPAVKLPYNEKQVHRTPQFLPSLANKLIKIYENLSICAALNSTRYAYLSDCSK